MISFVWKQLYRQFLTLKTEHTKEETEHTDEYLMVKTKQNKSKKPNRPTISYELKKPNWYQPNFKKPKPPIFSVSCNRSHFGIILIFISEIEERFEFLVQSFAFELLLRLSEVFIFCFFGYFTISNSVTGTLVPCNF